MPKFHRILPVAAALLEFEALRPWMLIADDDEPVHVHDGDAEWSDLDLDVDSPDVGEARQILVTGRLEVTGCIHNLDTDGAVSLAVLGDVHAGSVAVGGQIVYVGGALVVQGVCAGSYNHGDMAVAGDLRARWLVLDDYTCAVRGAVQARVASDAAERAHVQRLDLERGITHESGFHEIDAHPIALALEPTMLDEDGNVDWASFVAALRAGERACRDDLAPPEPSCIEVIDERRRYLVAANVRALADTPLHAAVAGELTLHHDPYVRLAKTDADDSDDAADPAGSVFVQIGKRKHAFLAVDDEVACFGGRVGGGDMDDVAHGGLDDEPERVFRLAWRLVKTLEAMQRQTPAAVVRALVERLVPEGDDEVDLGWCSLHRADPDAGLGERLWRLGPRERHYTFEVDGNMCSRYVDDEDGDERNLIDPLDEAANARCVEFFRATVASLESMHS